jgi:hypothetical protein
MTQHTEQPMQFPSSVRSVIQDSSEAAWPVSGQGWNECSFTTIANALNLLAGETRHTKEEFIREVGPLFQPRLGGTLPPLKAIQLRRRGYGAHFGSLARTDGERVLRGLVDRGVPTIVDIYTAFQGGTTRVYGMHATLLVGYSEPYRDAAGRLREEYYLVDPQWPDLGRFDLAANNADRDGDGVPEPFPGNRTLARAEFLKLWTTRNYCPVFRTPEAHRDWYEATLRRAGGPPLLGALLQGLLFGSDDRLR